jgi:hypothetical protein
LRFVDSHNASGAREKLKILSPVVSGFQFSHCTTGVVCDMLRITKTCADGAGV